MHVIPPESDFGFHKHGIVSRHSSPIMIRNKAVSNGILVGEIAFLVFHDEGF